MLLVAAGFSLSALIAAAVIRAFLIA